MKRREGAGRGRAACLALMLAGMAPSMPGWAQESGLRPGSSTPFAVRDAFPQDRGALQLEGFAAFSRSGSGADSFDLQPGLKYGLADGLELRLGGGYLLGDASGDRRGLIVPGMRWRFMDGEGWRPALAVLGEVAVPFGSGGNTARTELSGIASWTTGRGPGSWGLHLNAGWLAWPEPGQEERHQGYRAGLAIGHVLGRDTQLALGYIQRTQDRGERDLSMIEAGFQHRLGSDLSFAVVAGAGLNEDSPRFRVTAGVKIGFELARR